MGSEGEARFKEIFPATRKVLSDKLWIGLTGGLAEDAVPEEFLESLKKSADSGTGAPGYAPDLAAIELAVYRSRNASFFASENSSQTKKFSLNPTLNLVPVAWRNLPLLLSDAREDCVPPEEKAGFVVTYQNPATGDIAVEDASDDLLLALKIVVEELDLRLVAKSSNKTVWPIYCTLKSSATKGALVESPSRIKRPSMYPRGRDVADNFFSSDVFTLQWHITQSCDLHCKHCYDRSDRANVSFSDAVAILDQLYDFCAAKNVTGQVSFSGGNPFLHPDFKKIYKEASDRGFALAILGNPVSAEALEDIVSIEKPVFYQVSLEGLEEYDDYVRGSGHFRRTLDFLSLLKEFDIYSMVMLTLSRVNIDQVIPLAGLLKARADLFTFNRLSIVGEAQNMLLPQKEEYRRFLEAYLAEAESNDVLVCKDNLINILLRDKRRDLFGGCAGHGCSAAFNFLSLLSDGEVHACRKLPSNIGNVKEQSIIQIYDSAIAEKYRMGPSECMGCDIRPVCGGCLAVAYSFGLDIFKQKDPMCFIAK
ncbi:MAG: selenobiotic family peptide radical SAM maturase [Nitrospiraceae bacterium]|nr:selenobiotic family peptide radical SAM maturase [Nitrospiraceae bacterium]